jgi:hypothetical protein
MKNKYALRLKRMQVSASTCSSSPQAKKSRTLETPCAPNDGLSPPAAVTFKSSVTGSVFQATAARWPVETRPTISGYEITAVGKVRPDESKQLLFWVNDEPGTGPADSFRCKVGDYIGWFAISRLAKAQSGVAATQLCGTIS